MESLTDFEKILEAAAKAEDTVYKTQSAKPFAEGFSLLAVG